MLPVIHRCLRIQAFLLITASCVRVFLGLFDIFRNTLDFIASGFSKVVTPHCHFKGAAVVQDQSIKLKRQPDGIDIILPLMLRYAVS